MKSNPNLQPLCQIPQQQTNCLKKAEFSATSQLLKNKFFTPQSKAKAAIYIT